MRSKALVIVVELKGKEVKNKNFESPLPAFCGTFAGEIKKRVAALVIDGVATL